MRGANILPVITTCSVFCMKGLCFVVLISLAAQEVLGFGLVFLAHFHVEFKPGICICLTHGGCQGFHHPVKRAAPLHSMGRVLSLARGMKMDPMPAKLGFSFPGGRTLRNK